MSKIYDRYKLFFRADDRKKFVISSCVHGLNSAYLSPSTYEDEDVHVSMGGGHGMYQRSLRRVVQGLQRIVGVGQLSKKR